MQTPSALAITLTRFTGSVQRCGASFEWEAATELNGDYYVLEQSTDGAEFLPAAIVKCKNSASGSVYTATTENLRATNYFRLKRMDLTGEYDYSHTISLSAPHCNLLAIIVTPNPAQAEIRISGFDKPGYSVQVFNAMNALMHETRNTQVTQTIDVSQYPTGTYLLRVVSDEGKLVSVSRFIKE
jgi:hypothetical protein